MKSTGIIFILQLVLGCGIISAQEKDTLIYCDLHSHVTMKNYPFSIIKPDLFSLELEQRLRWNPRYFNYPDSIRIHYFNKGPLISNWEDLHIKIEPAYDSHWGNYSQGDFNNLLRGKFKFVCSSISPPEKPNLKGSMALVIPKVRLARWLTRMPLDRMKTYDQRSSWEEFKAEYYYTKLCATLPSPEGFTVQVINNRADLLSVTNDPKRIGLILTIEGAHVLHGAEYYRNGYYNLHPLSRYKKATKAARIFADSMVRITNGNKEHKPVYMNIYINHRILSDVLSNIDSLRNLTDRIAFITGAHFTFNDLFGFDKATDKEDSRFLLTHLAANHSFRKKNFFKPFEGIWPASFNDTITYKNRDGTPDRKCINNQDHSDISTLDREQVLQINMGRSALDSLLDVANIGTDRWKPIFFDLKHTDELSFLQFLAYRHTIDPTDKLIPLFVSHVAASGEKLKTAVFTSQCPMSDRYKELSKPSQFYNNKTKWKFRSVYVLNCRNQLLPRLYALREPFFRYISNSMTHVMTDILGPLASYDTLIRSRDLPAYGEGLSNTLGWFNTWSINLADEEIRYICQHDGMIGLMLDDRVLGRTAIRYKKKNLIWYDSLNVRHKVSNPYYDKRIYSLIEDYNGRLVANFYQPLYPGFIKPGPILTAYGADTLLSIAPFLRNLLYMAEQSGYSDKRAWEHFCLGSDFDGLINPADMCPTQGDVPAFKNMLVNYFNVFCDVYNITEYTTGSSPANLYPSERFRQRWGITVDEAMNMVFSTNMQRFMYKFFPY